MANLKTSSFPELSSKSSGVSVTKNEVNGERSNAAFVRWFRPVIQALRDLGGSATPADIRKKIIENETLSNEELNATRGKTQVNKFENEVSFAKIYLVKAGFIDNNVHGIWVLTDKGRNVEITNDLASEIFKNGVTGRADTSDDADKGIKITHFWLYSPGNMSGIWDDCCKNGLMLISYDEIGDLNQYKSKSEMKDAMKELIDSERPFTMAAHATWQFVHDMKPGDVVFVKRRNSVIGRGVVLSDYQFDDSREYAKNVRTVNWTHIGEWPHPGRATSKTLTDITVFTDYIEELKALFENDETDIAETTEVKPTYGKDDFIDDVYMDGADYDTLVGLVCSKCNLILQGPPGVGKTFAAKRLAYSIMGEKDPNRVMMVQFHQSYSYEDFIMGFRPSERGFELKRGAFYKFCKKAEIDSEENKYFCIIDEINRGNLSKIFGELFMLIENDKRGVELQLLYSDEKFSVPKNVYIIGMMNTADRSLAMLDYALRRRFAFYEIKPGFNTDGFRKYRNGLNNAKFDKLIQCVEQLNESITRDESLGEGFCVGHSYFCNLTEIDEQTLTRIVEYELIPLLKEYWFDDSVKVKNWAAALRNAIK